VTGGLVQAAKVGTGIIAPGIGELAVLTLVARQGGHAATRYLEFFTAQIRNPNTRAAYARACDRFLAWCEVMGLPLPQIGPVHVAAYVEQLGREHSAPTVKQQLAAVRVLFDWLVVRLVARIGPGGVGERPHP
jgi:site-specific recombinase XerD